MNRAILELIQRLILANLAVGLVMFVASQNATATADLPTRATSEISVVAESDSTSNIDNPTERAVRKYYKEHPLLIDIARCESRFIQFDKDGSVHRGVVNNKDVGVMQINEKYHLKTAEKMGIDIYTLEGNLEYGLYLYERGGSQPWSASAPCWGKAQIVAVEAK